MVALRFTFKGIILQIPFCLQHFNKHYVHVQGHQIIGPFYAACDVAWSEKNGFFHFPEKTVFNVAIFIQSNFASDKRVRNLAKVVCENC